MAIDTLGANALASNSVTTAKIANDAVTGAKIPADAVVASDIADGSITSAKLASTLDLSGTGRTGHGGLKSVQVFTSSGTYTKPTGVKTVAGNGFITISWESVQDAMYYNLYYLTSKGVHYAERINSSNRQFR